MRCGKRGFRVACALIVLVLSFLPTLSAGAATVYESDNIPHEEGYIFVGESHAVKISVVFGLKTALTENMLEWSGAEDIFYEFHWDDSKEALPDGGANTFIMKGNLFFVFEGLTKNKDGKTQSSPAYVYSDGEGERGRAVEKIHEIMDTNPNIIHWNIISLCGAISAGKGEEEALSYASSYRNWIDYEFPDADCYFLSVATMVKGYRNVEDKDIFNDTLAEALPEQFLDYTNFYAERNPEHLIDTIHWDDETYLDLVTDVLLTLEQKRAPKNIITGLEEIRYTNDTTVIYEEPMTTSKKLFPTCDAGIPIEVTGVTNNGFYQIIVDGGVCYALQTELSEAAQ